MSERMTDINPRPPLNAKQQLLPRLSLPALFGIAQAAVAAKKFPEQRQTVTASEQASGAKDDADAVDHHPGGGQLWNTCDYIVAV